MIKIINLNKYYKTGMDSFHALKDINLEFNDQGMHFILGKSGSGKSTLLNVIGGIDSYDSGEIIVDNVSTKNFSKKELNTYRNAYVGFIFQEFNVLKSLTVYDNIALSLELQHEKISDHKDEIQAIIDQVGLTGLENRLMNQLSGGQRQRVAIARSLIKNPKLLIADEPTGNLDSKNSKIIMDLLKSLSKDRLVIIVSHNDKLAHEYADRIIEIKDGTIMFDDFNQNIQNDDLKLNLISVPLKTSLHLSLKAVLKNLKRFIFISLLFTIALIFAGVVINMTLANTTLVYAKYQNDYQNNVVGLVSNFQSRGFTTESAFYSFQKQEFLTNYKKTDYNYCLLEGIKFNLPINPNNKEADEFYLPAIDMVYLASTLPEKIYEKADYYSVYVRPTDDIIKIFITDYLAESLIHYNYFNNEAIKEPEDLLRQEMIFDNLNRKLVIIGIVETNFNEFKQYFNEFDAKAKDDPKAKAAFFDNSLSYNGIYLDDAEYQKFFNSDNLKYFNTDIIYNMVADTNIGKNVKITSYPTPNEIDEMSDDSPFKNTTTNTQAPTMHAEGEPIQVALTTGFFEKVLNIHTSDEDLADISKVDFLFKKVYYEIPVHLDITQEPVMQKIFASNFISMTSYVPADLNFIITTIVPSDDAVIYFAPKAESNDYSLVVNANFLDGSFLTIYFNDTKLNNDQIKQNAKMYRKFINSNITISNISFKKILLVDSFINDNLPLFIGVFFVFTLFSVLLIFNFVIINIKNNTRDIGIYMSLGFSGWKIALIYLFQVVIIGLAAFILSTIGTSIFLMVLDHHFTGLSSVNLSIIKMSFAGIGIVLLMSLLIPTLSVSIPLYNLSRKNPVDVIKSI